MGARGLFFVGKPPLELSREFPLLRSLPYDLVLREARPRASGTILVLDDFGIARVDPVLLAARVRAPYTRVILVPGPFTSAALLREWREAGFDEAVAPAALARAVLEAARGPILIRVPDAAWVPEVHGDPAVAADLLRAVPKLPRPTVEEWAGRAGISARRLRLLCRDCFRHSPRSLLWLRTDAIVRRERRRRIPVDELARAAGFRDRHALYHAYRDRDLPFPPPGPGAVAPPAGETPPRPETAGNRPAESGSRPAAAPEGVLRFPRRDDDRPGSPDGAGATNGGPAASR